MRSLINLVTQNPLYRVASANSIAMLIKVIGGFLTSKFLAIYVGAEGLALFGNLRDFVSSLQAVSTLGLYNGLVKYVSEFKQNVTALSKAISTIFFVGFFSVLIAVLAVYFNADWISLKLFETRNYAYIVKLLAAGLPLYGLNLFSIGILNGYKKFRLIIVLNIIGHVFGTSLMILLIIQDKVEGALLALILSESLVFLITLFALIYQRSFLSLLKVSHVSMSVLKKLSTFSIMALFSAFVLPIITLLIREHITDNIGLREAGFWEAMTRISRYYLMFVTTLLSLYILPRFSEITTNKDFKKEVMHFYKYVMPIFILGLIIIYLLRDYIVIILFNETFKAVSDLFFWQLLGDLFKVMSLIISFQFLAKRMFWEYMITEVFSFSILYIGSMCFIDLYGVEGATMAHFVSYISYFIMVVFVFRKPLFSATKDV